MTQKELDAPTITASGTSISTLELTISALEGASGFHIAVASDDGFTNIVQDFTVAESGSFEISGLQEESTYYFAVTAIGTGNFRDGSSSTVQADTWTREFNLSVSQVGSFRKEWISAGNVVTVTEMQVSSKGRDASREFQIQFYAYKSDASAEEAVLLTTTETFEGLEAGTAKNLEVEVDTSTLGVGEYVLFWTIAAEGNESDVTENTGAVDGFLGILGNMETRVQEKALNFDDANTLEAISNASLTEWSNFYVGLWSENGLNSQLVLISYNSSLFTLETGSTLSRDGVETTFRTLSVDEETGTTQVFVEIHVSEEAAPQVETTENVLMTQLYFTPVGNGGLELGESAASDCLQTNGTANEVTVSSYKYDLNDDGGVTIQDLILFAKLYGKNVAQLPAASIADFDSDGLVRISDLILFAKHYGKASPNAIKTASIVAAKTAKTTYDAETAGVAETTEDAETPTIAEVTATPEVVETQSAAAEIVERVIPETVSETNSETDSMISETELLIPVKATFPVVESRTAVFSAAPLKNLAGNNVQTSGIFVVSEEETAKSTSSVTPTAEKKTLCAEDLCFASLEQSKKEENTTEFLPFQLQSEISTPVLDRVMRKWGI